MPQVRAKFTVVSVACVNWSPSTRIVKLLPIYDTTTPENERYSKATPCGRIELQIDNPPASDALTLGKTFYVDFTEAPQS